MSAQLERLRQRGQQLLGDFTTGQKVVVALAIVGLLFGGMLFNSWAGRPDYGPLFTNLDPKDAAAITDKLTADKVPYKLSDGGASILVPRKDVYQMRLKMSSAGLPTGGSSGYALLDKQGITTSEFRQRVDYQRALEGELVKTIQAIDGVAAASVHLVVPAQDVFAQDDRKPSASVLVKTAPGVNLGTGQVQAIVNLVSSSVEGLSPQQVTVADAKGQLLNAPGQAGTSLLAGDARSGATRTIEQSLEQSSQDMLNRVLGTGHAVVRVNAELDFDQTKTTKETFDTTNADKTLSETTSKETYTGNGTAAGGVLGPSATPVNAPGGANNYSKEDATKNFAVGRVTQEVVNAPGAVKRLSVAVLLDSASKGVDTPTVEKLVSAATGLDTTRGDTIAVDRMPFDQSQAKAANKELQAAAAARQRAGLLGLLRSVGLLLAVLAVLGFVLRSSRKPRRVPLPIALGAGGQEALAALAPVHDQQLVPVGAGAAHGSTAEVAAVSAGPALDLASLEQRTRVKNEIGGLIERQPEQVAQLLRTWLADRRG